MSSRKPRRPIAIPIDEPPPSPPVEPALEDCCGSGCMPCIFDIYEQQRERYRCELAAWTARQAQRVADRRRK